MEANPSAESQSQDSSLAFKDGSRCGFCEGSGKVNSKTWVYFQQLLQQEIQKFIPVLKEQFLQAQNESQILNNVSQIDEKNLKASSSAVHEGFKC